MTRSSLNLAWAQLIPTSTPSPHPSPALSLSHFFREVTFCQISIIMADFFRSLKGKLTDTVSFVRYGKLAEDPGWALLGLQKHSRTKQQFQVVASGGESIWVA